jgi:hypothetical protein
MRSFIALSDKFSQPLSQVNTAGPSYENDAFEVMNFQIDHWKKRAVGKHNLGRLGASQSASLARIPSWAILLNLRANAAHAMLMRPFFLAKAPSAAAKRNIQPALDLVSDTVSILSSLDESTDIYRKQHPYYNHILASSCALLLLVIAYMGQNRASLSSDLSDNFVESVGKSFKKALGLANAYKTSSRASYRLWNRLIPMKELLYQLGIVSRDYCYSDGPRRPSAAATSQPPTANTGKPFRQFDYPYASQNVAVMNHGASEAFLSAVSGAAHAVGGEAGGAGEAGMAGMDSSNLNLGWTGGLLCDWQMNEANTLFSEAEF